MNYGERPQFDDRDAEILKQSQHEFDAKEGPRVGDFVRMPDGELRRFTHDWGLDIQTTIKGNVDTSFYFHRGFCSFSGSLDPAIPKANLTVIPEVMEGSIWFFHHGQSGAHRGVYTKAKFRMFQYNK